MVLVVQCRQKAEGWLWRTGTDIVHTNDRLCAGCLYCGENTLLGLITGTLWHKVPVMGPFEARFISDWLPLGLMNRTKGRQPGTRLTIWVRLDRSNNLISGLKCVLDRN